MNLIKRKWQLCILFILASLPIGAVCEEVPDGAARHGTGGRPSEAQIAEWRAKREAQNAAGEPATGRPSEAQIAEWRAKKAAQVAPVSTVEAVPTADQHRHAPDTAHGVPLVNVKADEVVRGAGRPAGMSGMQSGGMSGRGGAFWLSDTPPMRGDGGRARGARGGGMMGGMEMGGERGGVAKKRLWLKAGNDPQKSGFAHDDPESPAEMILVTPAGKPEGESFASDPHKGLSIEMPVQGFYRLYLTNRKLQGDTLNINVAKAEVANFGHGGDEEEADRGIKAVRYLESAQIEIVRERKPEEAKFFQLKSGEEQAFIILKKGLPLQGARVRLVSYQGWLKEAVSDEQGRVNFQIIRDYFPPWNEFQKRFKATYLLIADTTAAESGSYKDQSYTSVRYQATLSGNYYPSPDDYLSYAWGLGIGLLMTLFCGVAVYLYRRRRMKPFQEVRFHDEK